MLLKAGPRPATARRPEGARPASARWPSPDFPQCFLCSGKSKRMHSSASCLGVQNGRWRVQFNTILIIISVLFDPFFRCLLLSGKRCHSLQKTEPRIQMNSNRRPFWTLKPDADLYMRLDLPLDKKKLWKIRTWPPGLQAAGPSQAEGRWATGLLLAKPE